LYWSVRSATGRALMACLDHNGIGYESICLDESKNENQAPNILALNPTGTLPFIYLKGEVYTDLKSIITAICQTYQE